MTNLSVKFVRRKANNGYYPDVVGLVRVAFGLAPYPRLSSRDLGKEH